MGKVYEDFIILCRVATYPYYKILFRAYV